MTLKGQLEADMRAAMKARDELLTSTLRMAITSVRNAEVAGTEAGLLLLRDRLDDRRGCDGLSEVQIALELKLGVRRQRAHETGLVEHRERTLAFRLDR